MSERDDQRVDIPVTAPVLGGAARLRGAVSLGLQQKRISKWSCSIGAPGVPALSPVPPALTRDIINIRRTVSSYLLGLLSRTGISLMLEQSGGLLNQQR